MSVPSPEDRQSAPAETVPAYQHLALAALMFFATGVFGFLQPFVPLYQEAAGLTKDQFGTVVALGTGAALLIQPVLGRLSDRWDRRRPLIVAAAIWAGCAYLGYRYASGFWMFTALTAAGVNGFQYINAAGGVLAGRLAQMTGQGGGSAYVRYRVWGSVGYIVVGMTTGLLVNRTLPGTDALVRADLDPIFTYGPLLFFAIAVLALFVPDASSAQIAKAAHTTRTATTVASAATPAAPPLTTVPAAESEAAPRDPNLRAFLIAYFLYTFGLYGASSFLPFYMRQLGASPFQITGMFSAGVVCEVLVMAWIGRWSDVYGRRPALAFSFLLMPLRLLFYIPANNPQWVMLVQILHGINFGIIGTIAVVFVNDLAQPHERGAMQARLAATAGSGLALAPLICGWLAEQFGIRIMFAAMSVVGMAAAGIFMRYVGESQRDRQVHTNPVVRFLAGK